MSQLLLPAYQDRTLPYITLGVIFAHFILLFFALQNISPTQITIKPIQRLAVTTITLGDPPPTIVAEPSVPIPQELIEEILPLPTPEPEPQPAPPEEAPPAPPEPVPEIPPESIPVKEPPPPTPKPEVKPEPKKAEPIKKPAPKKEAVKKTSEKKPKPPAKKETPKKNKSEPAKKTPAKKTPPKKPNKAPAPDPKVEAAKAKKKELLSKAQKSIAKIDQSRGKISAGQDSSVALTSIPGPIESLHVEKAMAVMEPGLSQHEVTYYEELANRLKLLLRLPEYGEVKIKLTLERTGKFSKVSIVNTKSEKNRKYIEKTLPTLTFPGFGKNFGSAGQYTFVIILSNDF